MIITASSPAPTTTMTTTTTTTERGARGINTGDDDGAAQEKERGVGFRVCINSSRTEASVRYRGDDYRSDRYTPLVKRTRLRCPSQRRVIRSRTFFFVSVVLRILCCLG